MKTGQIVSFILCAAVGVTLGLYVSILPAILIGFPAAIFLGFLGMWYDRK